MPLSAAMALSGLSEDAFPKECWLLYQHGAVLLQSPKLTSRIPEPPTSSETLDPATTEKENQENRPSEPRVVYKFLQYCDYLQSLDDVELELVNPGDAHAPLRELKYKISLPPKKDSIIYQNRNILDLGLNITKNWKIKTATVKLGPLYFFKNRSQYTRVVNGEPLDLYREVKICPDESCLFEEYRYR